MKVFILSQLDKVAQKVQATIEQANREVQLVSLLDAEYVFLHMPIFVNKMYTSPEQIWKNYLNVHNYDCKLITLSLNRVQHHNHIYLLKLEEQLPKVLTTALPADDNWTPVSSGGLDMKKKLNRFFTGHGEESLIDALDKVDEILEDFRTSTKSVNEKLLQSELDYFQKEVNERWPRFINRWESYYPLLKNLPFEDQLFLMNREVIEINEKLKKIEQTQAANTKNRVNILINKLSNIESNYVRK